MSSPASGQFDVVIIGAGIAGASIAYFLGPRRRVLVLEAEDRPGLHSTGRSAALFSETYGSTQVRALTRASRAFLESPPAGFAQVPLLKPRGALHVGTADEREQVAALFEQLRAEGGSATWLDADDIHRRVPVMAGGQAEAGVLEAGAADIDVDALHQGFLRGARSSGVELRVSAPVTALAADRGGWRIAAGGREWTAAQVVNAAGAWAEQVGRLAGAMPIGLQPKRRSAFLFDPPAGLTVDGWPCVIGIAEDYYFKPDAGLLLGSPANADPVPPHDVVPEEIDIATGIDRIERATTMQIRRPRRTWAGLRSFVPDGDLVGGFDLARPGLFWMAALGGYGIQTSVAMGASCAALVAGDSLPDWVQAQGLTAASLAVRRPGRSQT